jgi:amidase
MTQLAFQSALDIARRLRRRELGAVECLEYFCRRVERYNPSVNAVVALDRERALVRARRADELIVRGQILGPLHGVPVTVKESFDLAGHPTTWGDPALRDNIAPQDDLVVQRLEAAGAIVFGKTNVPFRLMDFQTYNDIYGVTNNPWDLTRVPGGSSGGSAAAVAAGMTVVEVGSDIAGSIRFPAHYCGVYGHKPTYNLVGATRGAAPGTIVGHDLSVAGPLARSAEDLAAALRCLTGPNQFELPVWQPTLPEPGKTLKEYRVAVWSHDARVAVAGEISDRCQAVADSLAKLGATVSDTARPAFDTAQATKLYRQLLEAAVDPECKLKHREWLQLNNERAKLRLLWREFFKEWDVVIAPVATTVAFPHDHSRIQGRTLQLDGKTVPYFQQIFWPALPTLSYLPSTAFPTGLGRQGLPIGLQAFGNAYDDLLLIDFVRQLAREIGGFVPPPGFDDESAKPE